MGLPRFFVKSNDIQAHTSQNGKLPGYIATGTLPVPVASGGAINGFYINQDEGPGVRCGVVYPGGTNLWQGTTFSILFRVMKTVDSIGMGLFTIKSISPELQGIFDCFLGNGGGNTIAFYMYSRNGTNLIDQVDTGVGLQLNVWHDLFITWDGTTTANAVKCYLDAALIAQATAANPAPVSPDENMKMIATGFSSGITVSHLHNGGFAVWDTVEVPTAIQLDNGDGTHSTGSLNGAARTKDIWSPAFDGLLSTDPGVSNVVSPTSYTIDGITKVGTFTSPTSTDPGVGNVLLGVNYEINDAARVGTRIFAPNSISDIGVNIVSGDTTGTPVNIFQGEDRTLRFLLVKSDGTPYSLAGVTALTVVFPANGSLIEKTLGSGVTITDAVNGTLQVVLDNNDTNDLLLATSQSLEMIVENSTNKRIFQSSGVFNVLKPITET